MGAVRSEKQFSFTLPLQLSACSEPNPMQMEWKERGQLQRVENRDSGSVMEGEGG